MEILQAFEVLFALDQAMNLEGENKIVYKFEKEEGVDKLEELQKHPNITIYKQIE